MHALYQHVALTCCKQLNPDRRIFTAGPHLHSSPAYKSRIEELGRCRGAAKCGKSPYT